MKPIQRHPALRSALVLAVASLFGACASTGSRPHAHAAGSACPIEAAIAAPAKDAVPGAAAYAGAVQVTRLLKTQLDAAGQPLTYPTDGKAEITVVHVEVAPGGRTGWHIHPLPCVAYMLEGELQVTLIDGRVHTFKAGEALMEMVNYEHEGLNPGTTPAKLVMTVIGTEGQAFTVKTEGPKK